MTMLQLKNDTDRQQYYFDLDEGRPHIDYKRKDDRIYLVHTEVPTTLEGKGIGSALVRLTLEDIELKKLQLVPLCPFVAAYIERHPEWEKLVA